MTEGPPNIENIPVIGQPFEFEGYIFVPGGKEVRMWKCKDIQATIIYAPMYGYQGWSIDCLGESIVSLEPDINKALGTLRNHLKKITQ